MSTSNQRKRRRRWLQSDIEAQAEGRAIKKMHNIGPSQACSLRKTYRIGQGLSGVMLTGQKHRSI